MLYRLMITLQLVKMKSVRLLEPQAKRNRKNVIATLSLSYTTLKTPNLHHYIRHIQMVAHRLVMLQMMLGSLMIFASYSVSGIIRVRLQRQIIHEFTFCISSVLERIALELNHINVRKDAMENTDESQTINNLDSLLPPREYLH